LADVSETYTAVYARDGNEWVAEIAETGLTTRGSNVGEVRNQIRDALAQHLTASPEDLKVIDQFALPNQIKSIQSEVRASRSPEERAKMAASMTATKTAKEWAADLDLSQRAPAAVQWLDNLEGELDVDQMCFAITIAEQVGMYGDGEDEEVQAGEGTGSAGQDPTDELGELREP
jgi:predicted RNase H-like HicB family nuclease